MPSLNLEEVKHKVERLALPLLAQAKVDLVELRVTGHRGDLLIRFLADRPTGGITMGECARLNRAIVKAIDEDGSLEDDGYALEFSSPGIDHPNRKKKGKVGYGQ
ncbi:MAG: hypothetical protein HY591_03425 [Candidatus Omnitrophica bacterium]|nr:hypothetical protein [Candidatus Omnitrophota bacterium]